MRYLLNKIKSKKNIIGAGLFFLLALQLFSQSKNILISKEQDNLPWDSFVSELEEKHSLHFYYHPDTIPDFNISVSIDQIPLNQLLSDNLNKYHINVAFDDYRNIFLTKETVIQTVLPTDFFEAFAIKEKIIDTIATEEETRDQFHKTNKEYISKTITVGTRKAGIHKKNAVISGYVKSTKDGSPIIGGTIFIKELETGTASDNSGYYTLTVPKGKYTLVLRSVGSEEAKYKVEVLSDGRLDVLLDPELVLLQEVEISSEKYHHVRGIQMGYEKLNVKNIKEIPVVLGERDIVKVALLLPGVQTVGEGTGGFNVRGSPADQNMFYISNVPVYNTSHLFGFFSAFNPDVVNEFTLYKSNIPAKYGGRLSSIFDIGAKQGNQHKFSARGGISPITARILAEGPIIKEKFNFLVGLRSTYSDWVLKFVEDPDIRNSSGKFGDAVTNLSYNINPKNQIKLFTYYSYDEIHLASKTNYNYQNSGASLSWYHTFNKNHDLDLALIYSKYNFNEKNEELDISAYDLSYQLQHCEFNLDFTFRVNEKHTVSYGLNSILYLLDNGKYLPLNNYSLIIPTDLGQEKGIETGLYIADEWKILPRLTFYGGLRYNNYSYLGPNKVFKYRNNAPKTVENIIDTLHFANNALIKTYDGMDIRLAATYLINPDLSLKCSYNSLHQYIFMLSNTIAMSPTDKWKLVDYNIEPMTGDQISIGVYSTIGAKAIEASVEAYYKKVDDLVEYKDGADLIINKVPEMDVLQGKLDSYGIELMLKKPWGRLNGWINYTYSNATVVVDNQLTGEKNNFGLPYPANYDKPHAFNLVANYKFSRRFSLSGNLVYSTGRPITYPTAIYYQNGQKILHYSLRNEYRIPDHFRIDLSVTLEGNLKAKKILHGSWILSVYNLTGRNNAYSVYFKSENGQINGYKLSIFGSPIISLTYDFKLGNYAD